MSLSAFEITSLVVGHGDKLGTLVNKMEGDYTFHGDVRGIIYKRSGAIRIVVQNNEGILHIFSPSQLTLEKKAYVRPSIVPSSPRQSPEHPA